MTNFTYTKEIKMWYSIEEYDADGEYRFQLDSDFIDDREFIAQECARDYHDNHDGWESEFPLTFVLWQQETGGEKLGEFVVEREYEPTFRAYPR